MEKMKFMGGLLLGAGVTYWFLKKNPLPKNELANIIAEQRMIVPKVDKAAMQQAFQQKTADLQAEVTGTTKQTTNFDDIQLDIDQVQKVSAK
ncbi:hypothetical protein HU830_08350 [Lactobacillus sp. DCY120]|uniref:Uncharacterized protein n=1 Tax=Bombilactobacillus apium TaxID=2675299 RepID=A0A850R437_9LACO|nr:hypothetical protein [Bombilactobacillus apium]NVY97130.1 hypothetical protein [Bombilactobacillus apium]